MAQWREKCVYCKHSELFAGYVVSCDLAECEYEFNDFTYSNKTEAIAERPMAGKHYNNNGGEREMKYKKLLFVEDGRVDVEKITEDLKDEPIYIIRYRQGARIPEVIDLTDEYAGEKLSAIGFEVESERDKEEEACVQKWL